MTNLYSLLKVHCQNLIQHPLQFFQCVQQLGAVFPFQHQKVKIGVELSLIQELSWKNLKFAEKTNNFKRVSLLCLQLFQNRLTYFDYRLHFWVLRKPTVQHVLCGENSVVVA
ncbi:hypothetical protein FOCC_FOCC007948 [Frankliniella occidentalis]|nr:hypothetical protein FOCC_FOCC007948 [Frankliniella occidentalis]